MRAATATRAFASLAVAIGVTAAACGGDDGATLPVEDRCNPLGYHHCMAPWP